MYNFSVLLSGSLFLGVVSFIVGQFTFETTALSASEGQVKYVKSDLNWAQMTQDEHQEFTLLQKTG